VTTAPRVLRSYKHRQQCWGCKLLIRKVLDGQAFAWRECIVCGECKTKIALGLLTRATHPG
jgi:hypothetical protein